MALVNKRITELPERLSLQSGDYVAVDGTGGTAKYQLEKVKITLDATLTQEGQAAEASAVGEALEGKVDVETGKSLTSNDFTNADKSKLDGIEAQANKTVIDSTLTVTGQAADAKATGDEITALRSDLSHIIKKRQYMLDKPSKALFPEFASDFWCANTVPAAFTNKQVVFTVSGTQGDEYLAVSAVSPDSVQVSDVSIWTGFVLTTDGIAYDVYNALYDTNNAALQIYPPLKESVTNATFATIYIDSGATYTGMHLTADGYKAYIYNLYNKNPKHCEVGLYNESFNARTATTYPFQKISTSSRTPLYLGIGSITQHNAYLRNYFPQRFYAQFAASYTPYESKNGVYWDVNLNNTSGYLELLMDVEITPLKLPENQEVYVDVYIDNVLKSQTIITDGIGKRICVDYENAETGRLEIYANKWAPVNNKSVIITISKAVWWVNELQYKEDEKLFPVGVVVAQEFDSWGVYHDGITGVTLNNLINADAGVTVSYYNHSLGSQTTAWGMAYWYQNVYEYNPRIAITDFLINDTNSVSSSGAPATITGPDGKTYNNKITVEDFVVNTKRLIDFAVNNGIQPLVMRNFQHNYYRFIDSVIEAISAKYEP